MLEKEGKYKMLKDKIKSLLAKKENEPDKKKLENLVVFVLILIITIIIINFIWNGDSQDGESNTQTTDANKKLATDIDYQNTGTIESTETTNSSNTMVAELEEILSNISGVGKVKVMITYSETNKVIPVYNEESSQQDTEETDSEGGTRKITQTDTKKEVIYEENGGEKTLVTQSVISPTVEGAIITAEGAGDVTIKTNIIQAVSVVTGLSTHKIQVFEMSH